VDAIVWTMAMAQAQEWKDRVGRWKASGSTAPEFAARHGFSSRKLYDWSYRLRMPEGSSSKSKTKETTGPVRLLRVVPTKGHAAIKDADNPPNAMRLTMAGVSVDIHAGFDEATLRKVLCVVKALQDSGR
jgi:hypothetical protein